MTAMGLFTLQLSAAQAKSNNQFSQCQILNETHEQESYSRQARENLDRLLKKQQTTFAALYLNSKNNEVLGKSTWQPELMARAASLPKIAILLGVLELKKTLRLSIDIQTEKLIYEMTRRSNNRSSTELIGWVGDRLSQDDMPTYVRNTRYERGKYFIRQTLIKYELYNQQFETGIFLGKVYGSDPYPTYVAVQNGADSSSQAANASSVLCFYYKLVRDELPETELIYKYLYAPTDEECVEYRRQNLPYLCSVGHGLHSTTTGRIAYQKGGSLPRYFTIAEGGVVFYQDKILIIAVLTKDPSYNMKAFDAFVQSVQADFF